MTNVIERTRSKRWIAAGRWGMLVAAAMMPIAAFAGQGQTFGTTHVFIRSAHVNASFTQVTLPLFRGTSRGQTVYYVITDSSDRADAAVRQVNYSPKLANARGTAAVQVVTVVNGTVDFPDSIDFGQTRVITPGPAGFPPVFAQPGAVARPAYSPHRDAGRHDSQRPSARTGREWGWRH